MTASKRIYLVSMSGGKDSTAAFLFMRNNYPKDLIIPYFCDTGWEHPDTYVYLVYLERKLKIQIHRIKSIKYDGFADMCIKKKGFPARNRRFCTEELKIFPSQKFILETLRKYPNNRVINVTGVRKEESRKRSGEGRWKTALIYTGKSKAAFKKATRVTVFQPIVDWTTQEVFDFHKSNGILCNPLYLKGLSRVGCYPCIMCNNTEKGLLCSDGIAKVAALEKSVSDIAGAKRFFFYENKPIDIAEVKRRHSFNSLGMELGCMNHYGMCE